MSKRKGFREKRVDDDDQDPMKGPEVSPWGGPFFRFSLNTHHEGWTEFKRELKEACKRDRKADGIGLFASTMERTIAGEDAGNMVGVAEGFRFLKWLRGIQGWEADLTGRFPIIAYRAGGPFYETMEELSFSPKEAFPVDGPLFAFMPQPLFYAQPEATGKLWGLGKVNGKIEYAELLIGPVLLHLPIGSVHKKVPEPVEPDVVYQDVERARIEADKEKAREKQEPESAQDGESATGEGIQGDKP